MNGLHVPLKNKPSVNQSFFFFLGQEACAGREFWGEGSDGGHKQEPQIWELRLE